MTDRLRVFIRHWTLENSLATTQNSLAKFCLFPERALCFDYNPPVTLQDSPATPIIFLMKTLQARSSCSGLLLVEVF